jgi:hypothetical protein
MFHAVVPNICVPRLHPLDWFSSAGAFSVRGEATRDMGQSGRMALCKQVMPVTSHASEAFEAFPRLSCVAVVVVKVA